jgi:glycosyltransferase involved in cell wall biosynthesis
MSHTHEDNRGVQAIQQFLRPALARAIGPSALATARTLTADAVFDAVVILRLYLAPVVEAFAERTETLFVLDLDDDEVETREQLARLHAARGDRDAARDETIEADKYRVLESRWMHRFDVVTVCSDVDRDIVRARTGHRRIRVVPNGVDVAACERDARSLRARFVDGGREPRLLFVGSFGYLPNVDAATILCREVLPAVQDRLGRAVAVDLVGSRPGLVIAELQAIAGVHVHADVPDLAPYYERATVAVMPLRAGGGSRIKILEAFAYRVPVVSSAIGARGIDAVADTLIRIADDPEGLAAACARLIEAPAEAASMADAAFRLVRDTYDRRIVARAVRGLLDVAADRRPL